MNDAEPTVGISDGVSKLVSVTPLLPCTPWAQSAHCQHALAMLRVPATKRGKRVTKKNL